MRRPGRCLRGNPRARGGSSPPRSARFLEPSAFSFANLLPNKRLKLTAHVD